MNLRFQLLHLVGTPDRAWLVILTGILLLCREFTAPGRIVPGILGGVAVLTGGWALTEYRLNGHGLALIAVSVAALLLILRGRLAGARLLLAGTTVAALAATGARLLVLPPWRISIGVALATVPAFVLVSWLAQIGARARRNKVEGVNRSSR